MAEDDIVSIDSESPKKKSSIVRLLIYVAIILVGFTIMIIIANIVFNIRSKAIVETQQKIWAPTIAAKAEPLATFALEPVQLNLTDVTGNNPVFVKITMALAYDGKNNVKLQTEITARVFEIRDKIIRLISSKTYDDINSPDKQIALKKEIINQINSILINGVIEDIYMSEFSVVVGK